MTIADQLVVLQSGRIAQSGTPEQLYRRPANTFVAGFIGSPSMNLVEGQVRGGIFEAGALRWPAPGADGAVVFGVRPEDLVIEPDDAGEGRLDLIELLGPRYAVIVEVGDHRLTAVVEAATVAAWETPPGPGAPVRVRVRPGREHLFDAVDGNRRPD